MIDVRVEDGIATITMQYGKANALDVEFCGSLATEFQNLNKPDIGAIVLTGQGRMFCAGVDLKRLSAEGGQYVRAFLPVLHHLYDTVFFHPKPVIAAINGHAIAGGAVLAACADRRVMAKDVGRIGVTELQVGVPFPALAFEVVRFVAPPRYLTEFTVGAGTYPSDEALRKGWTDEVIEPTDLMTRAGDVALQFAALSPQAFAQTKAQIRQDVVDRMTANGAVTDRQVTDIWMKPETLARVSDYVAKTLKK